MKKIKLFYPLYFIIAAFTILACDTEPIDPVLNDYVPEEPTNAVFKVDFSGQTYLATATTVNMVDGVTTITATRSTDDSVFTLTIPGTTPGTYNASVITYSPSDSEFQYVNTNDTGMSGSVTINTVNTVNQTITGTFNFTGYWSDASANLPSVQFTNGSFSSLPYTSDTDPDPDPTPVDASFTALVDGEEFAADTYLASVGDGLIAIAGFKGSNGENIAIAIEGISEGTYNEALLYYQTSNQDEYGYANFNISTGETSGTVTITEIDAVNQTISGTFSFTGWYGDEDANLPSIEITQGQFENIPYEAGSEVGEDELSATVDGTDYDYLGDVIVTYAGAVPGEYTIGILGVVDNNHQIRLSFKEDLGVGTYPITSDVLGDATAYYTDSEGEEYQAADGSLVITSQENGWVSGTFSFTVEDSMGVTHEITNGEFNVEYDW